MPDQEDHMIYVWLDALTNYLTTTGGLSALDEASSKTQFWPANCQVVGKDILKFHAVYWYGCPLMLSFDLLYHS